MYVKLGGVRFILGLFEIRFCWVYGVTVDDAKVVEPNFFCEKELCDDEPDFAGRISRRAHRITYDANDEARVVLRAMLTSLYAQTVMYIEKEFAVRAACQFAIEELDQSYEGETNPVAIHGFRCVFRRFGTLFTTDLL